MVGVAAAGVYRGVGGRTDRSANPYLPRTRAGRALAGCASIRTMSESPLHSEHVALLRERHLGPPFPNDAIDDLVAVLRHVRLDPGEVLIRQGDTGDDLFLVIAGQVDVEVQHPDGTKTVVDTIGDGGVVGELALLTGQPRNATVVARAATDAARL